MREVSTRTKGGADDGAAQNAVDVFKNSASFARFWSNIASASTEEAGISK